MATEPSIGAWAEQIRFERLSRVSRGIKKALINPLANYLPVSWVKGLLRFGESELAAANWKDPGGWRSMVISYDGDPPKVADRLLVSGGTIPMALRNRRRLAAAWLAELIDACDSPLAHVLCLGAGPGAIIMDAMERAGGAAVATLVDLSSDAFEHGRRRAEHSGLADCVRFIQGDIRRVAHHLSRPVDIVKMIGICEYLTDEQIVAVAAAAARTMAPGAPVVFNSLANAHGTDRFFRRVFGLRMIHRSPANLEALFSQAGFGAYREAAEPLGVYQVILGRRQADGAGRPV